MVEKKYSIVISQLPLVGGSAGHNLLVLKDENGNRIGELNGLATYKNGFPKPIGYLPSDKLIVYDQNDLTDKRISSFYQDNQNQTVVFSGNSTQALAYWNSALAAKDLMNSENLPYPILGLGSNSNSVASTLIAAMGLPEPTIPNANGGLLSPMTPGKGSLLLSPEQIQAIQQKYGITSKTSLDGENFLKDFENNASGLIEATSYHLNGSLSSKIGTDASGNIFSELFDGFGNLASYVFKKPDGSQLSLSGDMIGSVLGSAIGSGLGKNNFVTRVTATTLIGSLGQTVGSLLNVQGNGQSLIANISSGTTTLDSALGKAANILNDRINDNNSWWLSEVKCG